MESNGNGTVPGVVLRLDRERRWRLDVPAFERACDGFEEVGLADLADNPLASLQELSRGLEGVFKLNRKTSKIIRVWVWAGLTGEDPGLTLADLSRHLTMGNLPRLALEMLPALTESIVGPPPATDVTEGSETVATGPSADSALG